MVNFAAALRDHQSKQYYKQRAGDSPEARFDVVSKNSKKEGVSHSRSSADRKVTNSKQSTYREEVEIIDGADVNDEDSEEWPEDAIGMKEERFEEIKGQKKIVRIRRKFKLENGSNLVKEYSTVERLN